MSGASDALAFAGTDQWGRTANLADVSALQMGVRMQLRGRPSLPLTKLSDGSARSTE